MNSYDLRNLQEAYREVVENQQLDEKVTRIRGEFKKPQPLNPLPRSPRKSGMENLQKGRKAFNKSKEVASRNLSRQKESYDYYDIILSHLLDESFADRIDRKVKRNREYAKKRPPVVANSFAERIDKQVAQRKKEKDRLREQVDLYDLILSHLLDEGYAETPEAAEVMMVNMSEEWRQSIVEGDALQNTIKRLEGKRDAMNREKPGSANTAAPGKQSVGAATYSAYQRLRGV